MRLIDADVLKRYMCLKCNEYCNDDPCEPSDCIFVNAIKETPTAYDVDVVVMVLEEKSMMYSLSDRDCIFAIPLNDAIEIVKRGGRNE